MNQRFITIHTHIFTSTHTYIRANTHTHTHTPLSALLLIQGVVVVVDGKTHLTKVQSLHFIIHGGAVRGGMTLERDTHTHTWQVFTWR